MNIEKLILEMQMRTVKCAVVGLNFRGHTKIARKIEEVMFFEDYRDFCDWWKTLENIFDPLERPVNAMLIRIT